jgi:hypothetical protein
MNNLQRSAVPIPLEMIRLLEDMRNEFGMPAVLLTYDYLGA